MTHTAQDLSFGLSHIVTGQFFSSTDPEVDPPRSLQNVKKENTCSHTTGLIRVMELLHFYSMSDPTRGTLAKLIMYFQAGNQQRFLEVTNLVTFSRNSPIFGFTNVFCETFLFDEDNGKVYNDTLTFGATVTFTRTGWLQGVEKSTQFHRSSWIPSQKFFRTAVTGIDRGPFLPPFIFKVCQKEKKKENFHVSFAICREVFDFFFLTYFVFLFRCLSRKDR